MLWWGLFIILFSYLCLMCYSLLAINKKKEPKIKDMDNKYDKIIRTEWFKNHQAQHIVYREDMESITWRQEETTNYYMHYLKQGYNLIVTGDVGDAIYRTGFTTFDEWARSDIGYFSSKCVASEDGRLYKEWSSERIKQEVQETIKAEDLSWSKFVKARGPSSFAYEQEWYQWLNECGDDFFGCDRSCWPVHGKQVAIRCRGHLIGLQMAMEQLKG